jgi:hypothetical protein
VIACKTEMKALQRRSIPEVQLCSKWQKWTLIEQEEQKKAKVNLSRQLTGSILRLMSYGLGHCQNLSDRWNQMR